MTTSNGNTAVALGGDVSNTGEQTIDISKPYIAVVTIEGTSPILFHRWQNEAVAEKAAASKNSRAKKTDNLDSYVYRTDAGTIGIPGEYLRGAIVNAARFRQDPRSTRKSAMDLYRAVVISLTDVADTGVKDPDYIDRRRVTIQRAGITRERPALKAGWTATFELLVQAPEYVGHRDLLDVITQAGRLIGVGDFRPSFGRFAVTRFEVVEAS